MSIFSLPFLQKKAAQEKKETDSAAQFHFCKYPADLVALRVRQQNSAIPLSQAFFYVGN